MEETKEVVEAVVVATPQNALNAYGLSKDEMQILKYQLNPGLTEAELGIFLSAAYNKYKLDPFRRQIYAVKRGGKMVIQAGIDGLRAIAARNPVYAGSDVEHVDDEAGNPIYAKCTVYKVVGGIKCGFSAIAYFKEFCPPSGQDTMWKKMPHVMIAKCAESAALRKAFPEDVSGLYSTEEMDQAK